MRVLLDFDETVTEESYPTIGRENFGWEKVVRKLIRRNLLYS
jgi:hypothetical protein